MSTVREQIIEAALTALNTGRPSPVPVVTRARVEDYTPGELPALTIKALREEGAFEREGRRSYFTDNTFTLRLEHRVIGNDSVADPQLAWAVLVLGGQNFTSGGVNLAEDCIQSLVEWQYASEDRPYLLVLQDFRVYFSTLKTDATRAQ